MTTTIALMNHTAQAGGHLIQKFLPSGKIDHNELWLIHLNKSLKSIH